MPMDFGGLGEEVEFSFEWLEVAMEFTITKSFYIKREMVVQFKYQVISKLWQGMNFQSDKKQVERRIRDEG
jgi:hypothetical protein